MKRQAGRELSPGVSNQSSPVSGGCGFSGRLKNVRGKWPSVVKSGQAELPKLLRCRSGRGDTDGLYVNGLRKTGWGHDRDQASSERQIISWRSYGSTHSENKRAFNRLNMGRLIGTPVVDPRLEGFPYVVEAPDSMDQR